jgi:hypothetical protein
MIPVGRRYGSSATPTILCALGLARVGFRKLEDDLLRVRGVDIDVEVVRRGGHASTGTDVNRLLLLLLMLLVGAGHRVVGEGSSGMELRCMMEVRWHPIVASVDRIVVDLVWVVVDMGRHNVH